MHVNLVYFPVTDFLNINHGISLTKYSYFVDTKHGCGSTVSRISGVRTGTGEAKCDRQTGISGEESH